MQNTIQNLAAMLQRNNADNNDDAYIEESEAKLARILQEASLKSDGENRRDLIETVNAFLAANDIAKQKILAFCSDFFDPTVSRHQNVINGELIQQHRYLQDDEFDKLYKFVKRHSADKAFGATVFQVMNEHGMTPPDIYKAGNLSRQDFSRAINPNTKSVTRQLAWQIVVGLHCTLDEADEVLFSAGYIRRNSRLDLTMEYFIRQGNYDIMAINDVLVALEVKPFSCSGQSKDSDVM